MRGWLSFPAPTTVPLVIFLVGAAPPPAFGSSTLPPITAALDDSNLTIEIVVPPAVPLFTMAVPLVPSAVEPLSLLIRLPTIPVAPSDKDTVPLSALLPPAVLIGRISHSSKMYVVAVVPSGCSSVCFIILSFFSRSSICTVSNCTVFEVPVDKLPPVASNVAPLVVLKRLTGNINDPEAVTVVAAGSDDVSGAAVKRM
uniref:Secreted protein n=1 Tax=Anopheles darlingi TaxID=43151 RepID=A0A2M4D4X2_ANODA